jgi:hypothetical protein
LARAKGHLSIDNLQLAPVLGPDSRGNFGLAIANHRLVSFDDAAVRSRWRDYAHGNKARIMALGAEELLRRFLLHTLPAGFVKIRHYGLLGNRCRHEKITRCRMLLGQPAPEPSEPASVEARMLRLTGINIARCPVCQQGRMRMIAILAPVRAHPPIPKAKGPPPRSGSRRLQRRPHPIIAASCAREPARASGARSASGWAPTPF